MALIYPLETHKDNGDTQFIFIMQTIIYGKY